MSPAERAFAEAHLGPLTEVVDVGWPGGPNRVWRLVGGRGTAYFKGFAGQRAFDRERRALADWGPALPAAPRVLAADDGLRALLLSPVAGIAAPETPAVFHAAGAALRRLHEAPHVDADPLPLAEALPRRLEAWRARGVVPPADAALARALMGDGALFAGLRRVPCHRDFQPRNWLIEGEVLGLIDFEHAQPDVWLNDLVRVALRPPALRRALLDGYGRRLDALDRRRLDALLALHAAGCLVWGAEHGDPTFMAEGRALFAKLNRGDSAAGGSAR